MNVSGKYETLNERLGLDYLTKARSLSAEPGERNVSAPAGDLWGDAAKKIFSWLTSQSQPRVRIADIPAATVGVNPKAVMPALNYLEEKGVVRVHNAAEVELLGF